MRNRTSRMSMNKFHSGEQVYKGKLKTGEEVAVKVQRPFVLETVTVDLHIIRQAAPRPECNYNLFTAPRLKFAIWLLSSMLWVSMQACFQI